jgi:hypothetical protein
MEAHKGDRLETRSRRLVPKSYLSGLPNSGVCDICGEFFQLDMLPGETLAEATRRFLTDYNEHICRPEQAHLR